MRLIILLFIINFTTACFSQDFYAGVNLGFTMSQVDGDSYGGFKKVAPSGGLFVRNTYGQNWGSSLGVFYKHKGSKAVKKENGIFYLIYEISLDYIEIPVLATYKLDRISIPSLLEIEFDDNVFVEFGIAYAHLLKASEDFGKGAFPTEGRHFKNYDISSVGGIFYKLNENWLLNLCLSYTIFLFPVRNHPGSQVYLWNRGEYNRNVSFSIIYEI